MSAPDITASNTPTFSSTTAGFDHNTAAFAEYWNTDKQKFLDNDMYLKKAVEALDARVTALENAEPPGDTTGPSSVNAVYNSTNFTENGMLTITVTATDPSDIDRVEFYKNGSLVSTDSISPYVYSESLTSANNGSHTYHVKVFDTLNNSTSSSDVTVTVSIVDTGPDVTLTIDDTTINGSAQTVTLVATTTPNPYDVDYVEFYHNTTMVHSQATFPYIYSQTYNYPDSGDNTWKVRAYDVHGNHTDSSVITVTLSGMTDPTGEPTVSVTLNGGLNGSWSTVGDLPISVGYDSNDGATNFYELFYSKNYGPWSSFASGSISETSGIVATTRAMNGSSNGIYRFRADVSDDTSHLARAVSNPYIVLIPNATGEVRFQGTAHASSTVTPSEVYEPVALLGKVTVPAGASLSITGDHRFRYNPDSGNLGEAQVTVAYMNYDSSGDLILAQVPVLNHTTSVDTTTTATGSTDILIFENTTGTSQQYNLYVNLKNPQGVGGTTIQGEVLFDFAVKLTS